MQDMEPSIEIKNGNFFWYKNKFKDINKKDKNGKKKKKAKKNSKKKFNSA